MPTFKLEEMDGDTPYGGDNDMYFRQWRLPSMKPVLDEKLDRDFQDAVAKKEQMIREKLERRQKHSQKYDEKFQELVKKMKESSLKDEKVKNKENIKFLREPTQLELKNARENLEKEFASPSSTARMVPFDGRMRPRQNPIFGEKMTGLKSLVLPPPTSAKPSVSTPKDPSFGAHETVFYPQTHDSFNLDHYNGSRPSFAFSGNAGATSTPVAKSNHFFAGGILEEEGDDSVFESSKYVTALESPIQPPQAMKKTIEAENQAKKAAEQKKLDEEAEQKRLDSAKLNQNPNRFGASIFGQSTEQKPAPTTGFPSFFGQTSSKEPISEQKPAPTTGFPSFFGQTSSKEPISEQQKPAPTTGFSSIFSQNSSKEPISEQKPALTTGFPSFFGQTSSKEPISDQKPAPSTGFPSFFGQTSSKEPKEPISEQKPAPSTGFSSVFGQKPTAGSPDSRPPLPAGFSSMIGQKSGGSSLFGQKQLPEAPKPEPTGFSSIFGAKPAENEQKTSINPINPGVSSFFGQKPAAKPADPPKFAFGGPSSVPPLGSAPTSTPKLPEAPKPEPTGFSSIFGAKPAENDQKPPINPGVSSIFGQKPEVAPPKFAFGGPSSAPPLGSAAPTSSAPSAKPAESKVEVPVKSESPESPEEPQKTIPRPYVLFKNYIALKKTLMEQKTAYEKSSDPKARALIKRTITEKVTVFTQRQTESDARNEILEFFKSLLLKKEVEGFAIVGEAPRLTLETDEDVNYAVYCIVEKYISLTELDEDLAQTISDLISRLSLVVRRVEKVFIVLMFNKSTLLRQNPDECLEKFVELKDAVDDDEKAHRRAQEWSQEQALVTLFFTVFTKNALFHSKGRKMVLTDDLLWKYVETSLAHVLEVPKAPFIILQLITICKPRLRQDRDRWEDMLETIKTVIIPELEEESFLGDEGVVGRLKMMLNVLQEA